jgi:hypothetical protein
MRASEKEKLIAKHMNLLGISREEAEQLVADDEAIDKGAKLFELTAEQEKASKQARQADRKPTVYKLDNTAGKRSKKVDDAKKFLLSALIGGIEESTGSKVEVLNDEREFVFHFNEKKYKVVLSAPRS